MAAEKPGKYDISPDALAQVAVQLALNSEYESSTFDKADAFWGYYDNLWNTRELNRLAQEAKDEPR